MNNEPASSDHRPTSLPDAVKAALGDVPEAERGDLAAMWHLVGQAPSTPPFDAAELAASIWPAIDPARRAPAEPPPTARVVWLRAALGVAAAVALLVAAGVWWWSRPLVVTAPPGVTQAVTLPDGSTVDLNSASRLTYARSFNEAHRRVRLDGEAYFDVRPQAMPADGASAFVVETFNARVTVRGTTFNVWARPGDPQPETVVTLETGVVHLAARTQAADSVVLNPGETARVSAARETPIRSDSVPVDDVLAWRQGNLRFNSVPLGRILAEVERRFDLEITTETPSMLEDPLSLYLQQPDSAEAVLRDIIVYLGSESDQQYRYERTDRGFRLMRLEPEPIE